MNSRNIIKALEQNGWKLCSTRGSHHHFKHPNKKGKVTVPHPKKNVPKGTLLSVEKQAGIKFK